MLTFFVLYLVTIPIAIIAAASGLINLVMPVWMSMGIQTIFQGSGFLGSLLPLYPHPGMSGLAGVTGIMPMFGWFITVMGYLVLIKIIIWLVNMFVSFLPWGTHAVKQPHRVN